MVRHSSTRAGALIRVFGGHQVEHSRRGIRGATFQVATPAFFEECRYEYRHSRRDAPGPGLLPVGIALLGFVLNLIVATSMAGTTDESWHVDYGISILQGSGDRSAEPLFDSKMPVSAPNALPRAIGKYLQTHGLAGDLAEKLRDFRVSRYATIAASFLLCLLVYVYTKALFGRVAALFAQLMFVISPNIIANSTLATTDLYVALATVLFLYCLRRFLLEPTPANTALAAFTVALAQLTKFSALYLYPVLFIAIVAAAFCSRFRPERFPRIAARQIATLAALTVICSLVAINAGFVFHRTFTPLARYQFRSQTFQRLKDIPFLRQVPLPVPYSYVQGLDLMSYNNATGATFCNIVLLDQVRGKDFPRSDGFLSYYLVAYVLKEPLGMQVLLVLGLLWVIRHRKFADFLTGEGLLLAAAAVFFAMLSFFSNTQIGVRHILPVHAIFIILSGGAFATWREASLRRRLPLGGCLVWAAISAGSYFPHMIPYFNEIVADRRMAFHYLIDSNLGYGQDKWVVDAFLKNNPDVVADPPHPVSGRVLVDGNLLGGLYGKADYWLRLEGRRPVAQVGYAHFLFDIPPPK
jgi:4-amino-4-deoxy-L-arabinose transferase-like glycosyltransferase